MPLYEFLRLAIEKLESSQQKKCSVDLSSEVTENGHITAPSVCDDAALDNSVTGRIEKSGGVEYIFNGISPELASGDQLDLSRHHETVPWLSYPADGNLQDYSSSVSAKKVLAGNGSSFDETVSDLDAVKKLSCMKAHPWMHHNEDICNCRDATFVSSLVNSRKILAEEPTEVFVDGKSKKTTLQNKSIAAASSSVSCGNTSADERVAHEQYNTKRKFSNIEESECQSDKLQNECKKPSPAQGGRGVKKSRAAEVHNLSERRRRDRINEKMRALQELIPNCNKADKASVLDEAIEYLKNLKHQVQMMSLGSGLCMPPLMFPPGSRHMYHAPMPHYSYMGMRMGMGMGMMNPGGGGSPLCPVFPILPVPGHPGPGAHLVPHGWHQTSALRTVLNHNGVPTKPSDKNVFNVEAS